MLFLSCVTGNWQRSDLENGTLCMTVNVLSHPISKIYESVFMSEYLFGMMFLWGNEH